MSYQPVLRFVAFTLYAMAAACVLPLVVALTSGRGVAPFAVGLAISAFLGGALFILSTSMRRTRSARSGFRELILALMIFWIAVPFIAALPFLLQGLRLTDAWFEAVSALTTTGAWLSEPTARSAVGGMLYRASLEWLGGLASLATAAAVFVRPEFVGIEPPIPPFARGRRDSYLRAFSAAIEAFAPVYASVTLLSFSAFLLTGVEPADAATLAMSLMASGGFMPFPGGLMALSPAGITVATLTMIVSAINFVVIARLALQGSSRLKSGPDPETKAFLLLIIPLGFLLWTSTGAGDWDKIPAQIVNGVSLLSTNGFFIGERPGLTPVLVTAVIGGAAVSTAGGIKLLRWLITFGRAGQELWRLSHPGGVIGRDRPLIYEFGVWIHTIAFTMVLAALVLTVAFFGYNLELAAATAVAVVTNAGPLLSVVEGSTADFVHFAEPLRILLALGMIAGRLELVLLFLLIDRNFWRG
ncbi:MAG: potassium transporter TrkG [Pseudomonadota bacterium]